MQKIYWEAIRQNWLILQRECPWNLTNLQKHCNMSLKRENLFWLITKQNEFSEPIHQSTLKRLS